MRQVQITEIRCKSLLTRTRLGVTDWTVNPYNGCAFGCMYCYVPQIRAFRKTVEPGAWGEWVTVKVNAADVARREMVDLPLDDRIMIGSWTDAWQPLEKQYGISRAILEELRWYPHRFWIITRSPLLLRDLDILRQFENLTVTISVPTLDEAARKIFEPYAPGIPGRLELTRRLIRAGIHTYWGWAPQLPGVDNTPERVRQYVRTAKQLGVHGVWTSGINYWSGIREEYRVRMRQYEAGRRDHGPRLSKVEFQRLVREEARAAGLQL